MRSWGFDLRQDEFNFERAHQTLGQHTPSEFYQPSPRRLGENDKPFVYSPDHIIKEISASGHIAHEGRNYFVGDDFVGRRVALNPSGAAGTEVCFANILLGHLAYDAEGDRFNPTVCIWPHRPREVCHLFPYDKMAYGGGE